MARVGNRNLARRAPPRDRRGRLTPKGNPGAAAPGDGGKRYDDSVDRWRDALAGKGCHPKREGDGYRASCPGPNHANGNRRNPALSIRQGDGGRVLATCHSGCDFGDIVSALGLDATRGPGTTPHGPDAESWVYRDAAGVALLTVHRRDTAGGGKRIWRDPKGAKPPKGGWPLLRLASLRANPDRPMLVVEGERTCDHAGFLFGDRYECTTAVGGAGKARQADWTPAKDRRVAICPDNDDAGYRHAQDVATLCREAGAREVQTVRREDLEPCAKGWDLADMPPAGLDIEALLENSKAIFPTKRPNIENRNGGWTVVGDLLAEPMGEEAWQINGLVPWGGVGIIVARPKAGKTTLGRQMVLATAQGTPLLDRSVRQGAALYMGWQPLPRRRPRIREMARRFGRSCRLFCAADSQPCPGRRPAVGPRRMRRLPRPTRGGRRRPS